MALAPLDGKIPLEDGISIRDLMNLGEATFSVKGSDLGNEDDPQPEEDVFNPESLLNNVNLDTLNLDSDHVGVLFETLKEGMTNVNSNGSVMKKVLRGGIGDIIPQDSLVSIHYDAYLEFTEVPFDSSTLRGKALEFLLGTSGVVPGLDIAVASMREREKSQFILQPSVAFGRLGCPPRIPPNAEMLFIVEVMWCREGSDAAVARATAAQGQLDWENCKSAFKALNKEGIAFYNERRFKDCKIRLEKAKNLLERCNLKDEGEEKEHKRCLFKACLNLAMAFNQLTGSHSFAPSAIINAKEAISIEPDNPKAHLQWGKALVTLGELERAKEHLLKAKRKLPTDPAVTEAWEKLEKKKKQEQEEEKKVWKRAFNPTEDSTEEKEKELSSEAQEIFDQLKDFASNPSKDSLTLPGGITPKEREDFKACAEKLNLTYTMRSKSILITKR